MPRRYASMRVARAIVEPAAMHRAPEIGVELEIGATPFLAHGAKELFEMPLHLGMRAVERVPWPAPPAAERHAIGSQRRAGGVLDEPAGMLLKDRGLLFGNERRDPDRGLESAASNLIEHGAHAATERRAGREPVAHRALIPVVDLHVLQTGEALRDDVEVVEHLLCGDARAEAIPRAPAGRRRRGRADNRGWCTARRSPAAASSAARSDAGRDHQFFQRPRLARSEGKTFAVEHRSHRRSADDEPSAEPRARREGEQRRVPARRRERQQAVVRARAVGSGMR